MKCLSRAFADCKIEKYFDHVISTDKVQSYKPDPDTYQLGIDTLKLKKEEILFVAFAGWDHQVQNGLGTHILGQPLRLAG